MKIQRKITQRDDKSIDIYFNDINKYRILTPDEELALFIQYKDNNDPKAKEKLLKHNLRFVISVAKNYQTNMGKVPLNDLIAMGNYGLIKAVEKFDYTKGFKFISYAVWWVKQTILEHLNNNQIRIPLKIMDNCRRIIRLKDKLFTETQNEYDIYDLYDMGLVREEEINMFNTYNTISYPASLSSTVSEDENLLISDTIEDSTFDTTKFFLDEHNKYIVNKLIISSKLNDNEKDVIRSLFGINKSKNTTIDELGNKYSISAERIRQIKSVALSKMIRKSKLMNLENGLL